MMFKRIIILFVFASSALAQTHKIEGFVYDSSTEIPLSFASIRIEGTTSGTAANIDGFFSLKLKPGRYKLIFSFIGYKSDSLSIESPTENKIEIGLDPQ